MIFVPPNLTTQHGKTHPEHICGSGTPQKATQSPKVDRTFWIWPLEMDIDTPWHGWLENHLLLTGDTSWNAWFSIVMLAFRVWMGGWLPGLFEGCSGKNDPSYFSALDLCHQAIFSSHCPHNMLSMESSDHKVHQRYYGVAICLDVLFSLWTLNISE